MIDPCNFNFDANGVNSRKPIADAWAGSTTYPRGATVTHDGGKLYLCITQGTTASTGPSGTSTNITDGSAHWSYRKPWSRFWVIIETAGTTLQSGLTYYDDGHVYDEGNVYDGIAADAAADIVSMFTDWKAAHSACWGVALSTQAIDPTATPTQDAAGWWNLPGAGQWGQLIDSGTHKGTRPPYLTFLLDRSQF